MLKKTERLVERDIPFHHPIVLPRYKTQGVQQAHPWEKHQSHPDNPDFCIRQKHIENLFVLLLVYFVYCFVFFVFTDGIQDSQ